MLRSLELFLKRLLVGLLRLLFASRPVVHPFSADYERILVIRQHNQLGDMLCVVPLLRALRSRFPRAHITLMTSPVNNEVMRGNAYLSGTLLYDKQVFLSGGMIRPVRVLEFVRSLRRRRFDLVLVPATVSTSFTSDFLARLSGAPVRIGAASLDGQENPSSFFFNVEVPLNWRADPHRHQVLRNMDLLSEGDIRTTDLSLEMTLTEEEQERGDRFLRTIRRDRTLAIGYHPGAGKPPNRWLAERFAELINALAARTGCATIITSGPMDEDELSRVIPRLTTHAEVLRNQPIRHVAAVLRGLDLYITNDTGLMHVAGAVGIPVLSLFGPTDPQQWAPIGPRNRSIQTESHIIGDIPVSRVLSDALEMLGQSGKKE
jgi:ADP-heptose:LPS heptosyltransferase